MSTESLASSSVPYFLTVAEAALLLRTTPGGIYAMAERGKLPGVTKLGRRLLIHRDTLLGFLTESRAPSSKEVRR